MDGAASEQKNKVDAKANGKVAVRRGNNAPFGYVFFRINSNNHV
jgi:hypothetical protein